MNDLAVPETVSLKEFAASKAVGVRTLRAWMRDARRNGQPPLAPVVPQMSAGRMAGSLPARYNTPDLESFFAPRLARRADLPDPATLDTTEAALRAGGLLSLAELGDSYGLSYRALISAMYRDRRDGYPVPTPKRPWFNVGRRRLQDRYDRDEFTVYWRKRRGGA